MSAPLQLVICGQSIAWAAVEIVLRKSPNLEIIKITRPEQWADLVGLNIDVVLFDENVPSVHIENLKHNLPSGISLLGLNFDNSNLVMHLNHQHNWSAIKELVQIFQHNGDSLTSRKNQP